MAGAGSLVGAGSLTCAAPMSITEFQPEWMSVAAQLEDFIAVNRKWLSDEAVSMLRAMTPEDQRRVIDGGSMSSCRDPVAVLRSRVRQARESAMGLHMLLGGAPLATGAGLLPPLPAGLPPAGMPAALLAGAEVAGSSTSSSATRGPRPATSGEVEQFIGSNREWLTEDAEQILRSMNRVDAKRVIAAGTMSNCRDPIAVIRSRIRTARDSSAADRAHPLGAEGALLLAGAVSRNSPRPATPEELETFIISNRHFLGEDAEEILRAMSPVDRKRVIAAGTMSGCRDPVAVIRSRVRQAREQEHEDQLLTEQRLQAAGVSAADPSLAMASGAARLAQPATPEELEAFIVANKRWMTEEAEELLRAFNPMDQKRVIAAGTMSGCRDAVAVVQTRVKKAREMEQDLDRITRGALERLPEPDMPVPTFTTDAAVGYMFTQAEPVPVTESRFAKPVAPPNRILENLRKEVEAQERPHGLKAGLGTGIGGVVEIIMRKYGCAKGDRLRCIGETPTLWQFEGGKTAPKIQEGIGWRWVLLAEEAAKKAGISGLEEEKEGKSSVESEAEGTETKTEPVAEVGLVCGSVEAEEEGKLEDSKPQEVKPVLPLRKEEPSCKPISIKFASDGKFVSKVMTVAGSKEVADGKPDPRKVEEPTKREGPARKAASGEKTSTKHPEATTKPEVRVKTAAEISDKKPSIKNGSDTKDRSEKASSTKVGMKSSARSQSHSRVRKSEGREASRKKERSRKSRSRRRRSSSCIPATEAPRMKKSSRGRSKEKAPKKKSIAKSRSKERKRKAASRSHSSRRCSQKRRAASRPRSVERKDRRRAASRSRSKASRSRSKARQVSHSRALRRSRSRSAKRGRRGRSRTRSRSRSRGRRTSRHHRSRSASPCSKGKSSRGKEAAARSRSHDKGSRKKSKEETKRRSRSTEKEKEKDFKKKTRDHTPRSISRGKEPSKKSKAEAVRSRSKGTAAKHKEKEDAQRVHTTRKSPRSKERENDARSRSDQKPRRNKDLEDKPRLQVPDKSSRKKVKEDESRRSKSAEKTSRSRMPKAKIRSPSAEKSRKKNKEVAARSPSPSARRASSGRGSASGSASEGNVRRKGGVSRSKPSKKAFFKKDCQRSPHKAKVSKAKATLEPNSGASRSQSASSLPQRGRALPVAVAAVTPALKAEHTASVRSSSVASAASSSSASRSSTSGSSGPEPEPAAEPAPSSASAAESNEESDSNESAKHTKAPGKVADAGTQVEKQDRPTAAEKDEGDEDEDNQSSNSSEEELATPPNGRRSPHREKTAHRAKEKRPSKPKEVKRPQGRDAEIEKPKKPVASNKKDVVQADGSVQSQSTEKVQTEASAREKAKAQATRADPSRKKDAAKAEAKAKGSDKKAVAKDNGKEGSAKPGDVVAERLKVTRKSYGSLPKQHVSCART